ncbi:hypothetical protein B0O99DRAFT_502195 [Bisporella sp. PMI_857]|nr:hypothetical protein B0O99DRAFT_502195 [Bisporella sp. PMI_857]
MATQDSFIEDDDDCCPLCVEEFDLSDKRFRPCPCGYQICQFCFNNIRQNMNNLCPACRRPYDDKTIEWKAPSAEELKQYDENIKKNNKKKADQRQREAQKREVESLNRKHLSGLRVVQKNLVYVVGLSQSLREEEILSTLRKDEYFGQYGKILKIVVSKAKSGETGPNGNSLGVYVTFARKEDAQKCIAAVNGSQNGDRTLRAQLGTTKYCSAFLRNETCTNKQCMFLHEHGDSDDSYSRQDMSSINSAITQAPLPSTSSSAFRQVSNPQAPLQHAQPVAAAAQPMARQTSKDGSDSGDGSALPSSASWAKQRSRRGSHATSGSASSPAVSQSVPVTEETREDPSGPVEAPQKQDPEAAQPAIASEAALLSESKPQRDRVLINLLKSINSPDVAFLVQTTTSENADSASFPPLFDEHGGEKRRAMREQAQLEEDRLQSELESQAELRPEPQPEPVEEEEPESGSLQLGGEPEDRETGRESSMSQFSRRPSAQLPIQRGSNGGAFGPNLQQNFPQINGRTLTPQQQLLLMKSGQQSGFLDQFPPGIGNSSGQNPAAFQQQGHVRQPSRYASVMENNVKSGTNPKFMAQQSSMLTQQSNQYYGSSMPGPPPGLKSTGTPPISGLFGQGHGFGGSGGSSLFSAKENSGDLARDIARGRGAAGIGQVHDAGKREYNFSNFLHQYPSASSTPVSASGLLASLYGPQTGAFHDYGQKQKKKGKKHRHANTSSSGGGGLVDLADPSILQARMQQYQQQSNAGVGQGLFGGQAQGGYNQNMMHGPGFNRGW